MIECECGAAAIEAMPEPPGWQERYPDRRWDVGDLYCPLCDDGDDALLASVLRSRAAYRPTVDRLPCP